MNRGNVTMTRSTRFLAAVTLLALLGTSRSGSSQTPGQPPQPARSRADETRDAWNDVGNKLVAMAKDFPEDKYDFKLTPAQRSFAENLLHVAGVDYDLIRSVSGTSLGPDLGKNAHNPPREAFRTKAAVVALIQQAVADGAEVIKQQGDAGLDRTVKLPWGNKLVHASYVWTFTIEHSAEHYGQLVGYYRANNLVPPDSRR